MIAELTGRCTGCSEVWNEDELSDIHDLWGRVLAGKVMPLPKRFTNNKTYDWISDALVEQELSAP